MLNSLGPFLYHGTVSAIEETHTHTLIHGGPGMGKTAVLLELHRRFKQAAVPVVMLYGGPKQERQPRDRDRLIRWLKDPKPPTLLVDDLDWLYDSEVETLFRNKLLDVSEGHDKFRIVATSLTPAESRDWYWKHMRERAGARPPREGWGEMRYDMIDSGGLATFTKPWLDPWAVGWTERVARRLGEWMAASSNRCPLNQAMMARVAGMSGGHPWLVGKAAQHCPLILHSILAEPTNGSRPDAATPPTRALESAMEELEQLLNDLTTSLVERGLIWARHVAGAQAVKRFLELVSASDSLRLVSKNELTLDDEITLISFQRAGLLRRGRAGFEVPCEAIRHALLMQAAAGATREVEQTKAKPIEEAPAQPASSAVKQPTPETETVAVTLVPAGEHPALGGEIHWSLGSRKAAPLDIPSAEWEILWKLSHAAGQHVAVGTLATELGINTGAVTSRIQRLNQRLEGVGLSRVIDNVRGMGYVFTGQARVARSR